MKISILTAGTRGDVQPFVALALGLKEAGHDVTVAAGTNFEIFVTERCIRYVPLRADYFELMQSDEGKALLGGSPIRIMKSMRTLIMPMVRRLLDDAWGAAQGSDAIIYHPKALGGYHIAEKLDIPAFIGLYLPLLSPTRRFPNPLFRNFRLGGLFNKLSYWVVRLMTAPYHRTINLWRKEVLHLPPRSFFASDLERNGQPIPVLYCYSPHVIPTPDDWDRSAVVTGYWFLDRMDDWQPPADLVDFIEAGPPPVYVGFGSMAGKDSEKVTKIVVSALEKSGQYGVIATGWGGMTGSDLPDTVFKIRSAPHDWLFPRMAAVVHHGGANTVAAGLRAGKPTVVCPFFVDQPFWGHVVFELGVGPEPVPHKKLSVDKLAEAIHIAATDEGMRQRAAALGEKIRAEDGVARAVEVINERLSGGN